MNRYTFKIDVYAGDGTYRKVSEIAGEVQADRRSNACIKAWDHINPAMEALKKVSGPLLGVGDIHVEQRGKERFK